jgi:uncharacterized protein with NRDE domain
MCTVSIVPRGAGFRVICNRDERLGRPAAFGPRMRDIGRRRATFPLDPPSGGTWIGGNDRGLVAVLLNRTVPGRRPAGRRVSRGVIVPSLLEHDSLAAAVGTLGRIDLCRFEAFRIVLAQGGRVAMFSSARTFDERALTAPLMFTSSSLGDQVVERPRRLLFERLVSCRVDALEGQVRFHDHQWAEHPDVSVRMRRADAATVSRTTLDFDGNRLRFEYERLCC